MHAGEPDARVYMVAAWRDGSYFTEAERAALALTEAATRIADRPDPVPDSVWEEAAAHYNEAQLAALVIAIAAINAFNRVNAVYRAGHGRLGEPIRRIPPDCRAGSLTQPADRSDYQLWRAVPAGAARHHLMTRAE
jgi:hypothetical protein